MSYPFFFLETSTNKGTFKNPIVTNTVSSYHYILWPVELEITNAKAPVVLLYEQTHNYETLKCFFLLSKKARGYAGLMAMEDVKLSQSYRKGKSKRWIFYCLSTCFISLFSVFLQSFEIFFLSKGHLLALNIIAREKCSF